MQKYIIVYNKNDGNYQKTVYSKIHIFSFKNAISVLAAWMLGSFPDRNKSAPLRLHSVAVGAKRMSTGHPAPAGGFFSVEAPPPTETSLFYSPLYRSESLLR